MRKLGPALGLVILLGALVRVVYADGDASGPALGNWQDNANGVIGKITLTG